MPRSIRTLGLLAVLGPGLLTAATGVGAGDLATAGFAGARLGTSVLWAVALGALLKFLLTEGLTRWQLATGETILEGAVTRLGPLVTIVFALYLVPWTFFVGAALISASGVTLHAMIPVFDDPAHGKLVFGATQSILAVVLIWSGGFRLFERVMAIAVGIMFVAVVVTAARLLPPVTDLAVGLVVPRVPDATDGGLTWTIALMGGVGGTLTVLCYGYWIREHGRLGPEALRTCRIDLTVGYAATALFGMSMLIIANGMELDGSGAGLIVTLADELERTLGPVGRWVFLVGAWAAVASSLLGVWQAVPAIFADFLTTVKRHRRGATPDAVSSAALARTLPARVYLVAIALVPLVQVGRPFRDVQKYYAVIGAAFIPLLALVLLLLAGRRTLGPLRNNLVTTALLVVTLVLSVLAGCFEIARKL